MRMGEIVEELTPLVGGNNGHEFEIVDKVEIILKTIDPARPSRLLVPSSIKQSTPLANFLILLSPMEVDFKAYQLRCELRGHEDDVRSATIRIFQRLFTDRVFNFVLVDIHNDQKFSITTYSPNGVVTFLPSFHGYFIFYAALFCWSDCLYDFQMHVRPAKLKLPCFDKEELRLALLRTSCGENLFLDRVFDLFDEKKNGVIEFEEFIHALSVFHPASPLEKKIDFAFKLYDLRQTGYIEREEVRQMMMAMMSECGTQLEDDILEAILDKTFQDADADKDGKISKEEWKEYVVRNPTLLNYMTLPSLKDITTVFTSFIFNTEVEDILWQLPGNHTL